jgi:hypothetical protein
MDSASLAGPLGHRRALRDGSPTRSLVELRMTGSTRSLIAVTSMLLGHAACGGTDGPASDLPSPTTR